MELSETIRHRRSIRKFISKPVPHKILKEILTESSWSPSWGNIQPWKILVITGQPLEDFKKANTSAFLNNDPWETDIPVTKNWPSPYHERYVTLGKNVMGALFVERNNSKGRQEHYCNMFSLFGASALILISVKDDISLPYAMLDVGALVQTICLSAFNKGIGTCILEAAVHYPKLVHNSFSIDDSERLAIGIAMGLTDTNAKVNKFDRERIDIEESVRWIE